MKYVGIQNGKGGFHPSWRSYCLKENIPFKLVNCYADDIVDQLSDCRALMWHHSQTDPKDLIIAKQILFALEHGGMVVFPDFRTNWHFDDKVGQKYLLERLDLPMVRTYVYYDEKEAIAWANQTTFPKVFKLRGGAGSSNVKLIHNLKEAERAIRQAFGKGFSNYDGRRQLLESWRLFRLSKISPTHLLKSIYRFFSPPKYAAVMGREWGYVYFQDFIPNNDHDIRVIVIGDKAFAIKRMVRKDDFRASGSGHILLEKHHFDDATIEMAFTVAEKLQSQCTAFDFVFDNGTPYIVEISYGFAPYGYVDCPGYWDKNLVWHEEKFDPYGWMVDLVLGEVVIGKK